MVTSWLGERAAGDQPHADGLEILRADVILLQRHLFARLTVVAGDDQAADIRSTAGHQPAHRDRRRLDAGNRFGAFDQTRVERRQGARFVAAKPRADRRGHDVLGLEAKRQRHEILQAAQEETGAHDQEQRQRDLNDDQRARQPRASAAVHAASRGLQRIGQREIGRSPGGSQSEEHARQQRQQHGERQHPAIDADGEGERTRVHTDRHAHEQVAHDRGDARARPPRPWRPGSGSRSTTDESPACGWRQSRAAPPSHAAGWSRERSGDSPCWRRRSTAGPRSSP